MLMVSLFLFSACNADDSKTENDLNDNVPPVEEVKEENDEMVVEKNWVQIQYVMELEPSDIGGVPEYISPVETAIPLGKQTFQLYFAEAMDTESVENTIKDNFLSNDISNYTNIAEEEKKEKTSIKEKATLQFTWTDEKELSLSIEDMLEVPKLHQAPLYEINVTGAKTKTGTMLPESPTFQAFVVEDHSQLWRVSVDGTTVEQVSSWEETNNATSIIDDQTIILANPLEYVCCHVQLPHAFYVYNFLTEEKTEYPHEEIKYYNVMTNYVGSSPFMANKTGFFYAKTEASSANESNNDVEIDVNGFIHGAVFSKNKEHIIMVIGDSKEDVTDLKLAIYSIEENKVVNPETTLAGEVPLGVAYGYKYPVSIYDNGEVVTITMMNEEDRIYYDYSWENQDTTIKSFPFEAELYDNILFSESDDRKYQLYWGYGIYSGEHKIADQGDENKIADQYDLFWVKNAHYLVYLENNMDEDVVKLMLYDVDQDEQQTLLTMKQQGYYNEVHVIGVTEEWIYLSGRLIVR